MREDHLVLYIIQSQWKTLCDGFQKWALAIDDHATDERLGMLLPTTRSISSWPRSVSSHLTWLNLSYFWSDVGFGLCFFGMLRLMDIIWPNRYGRYLKTPVGSVGDEHETLRSVLTNDCLIGP